MKHWRVLAVGCLAIGAAFFIVLKVHPEWLGGRTVGLVIGIVIYVVGALALGITSYLVDHPHS